MGAQLVFQAADHLPFVFKGLRVLDAEFEGEKGNHQWSVASDQWPVKSNHWQLATDNWLLLLHHHFRRYLFSHKGFNHVADFHVAVVGDGDAALHAVGDLAGVIFEAAQ